MHKAEPGRTLGLLDTGVLLGSLLLIVALPLFPWYSEGALRVANLNVSGFSAAATSAPYAIWGLLAMAFAIVIALDLVVTRLAPDNLVPLTLASHAIGRAGACWLIGLALLFKFVAHVGGFGWGFYVDAVL